MVQAVVGQATTEIVVHHMIGCLGKITLYGNTCREYDYLAQITRVIGLSYMSNARLFDTENTKV